MTFVVIIIILVLCYPYIKKWMAGFMARRTEDFLRHAMGMPPRPGSREAKRQASRETSSNRGNGSSGARAEHRSRKNDTDGSIIPKEYAEDVEFVETIDYSDTVISERVDDKKTVYAESQVSDAEFVEIKSKK